MDMDMRQISEMQANCFRGLNCYNALLLIQTDRNTKIIELYCITYEYLYMVKW